MSPCQAICTQTCAESWKVPALWLSAFLSCREHVCFPVPAISSQALYPHHWAALPETSLSSCGSPSKLPGIPTTPGPVRCWPSPGRLLSMLSSTLAGSPLQGDHHSACPGRQARQDLWPHYPFLALASSQHPQPPQQTPQLALKRGSLQVQSNFVPTALDPPSSPRVCSVLFPIASDSFSSTKLSGESYMGGSQLQSPHS